MIVPAYSPRLDRAVALAMEAFRPKWRKGTDTPYLSHLLMVCALVGEHGGSEDQMIAAVLHDYLEDIDGASHEELAREFGPRVSALVLALSDCTGEPKPPWKERKLSYVARLRDEHPDTKLICSADKLHNSRSIVRDHRALGDAIFDRFRPSKEETLWYYRAVFEALAHGWRHPILDDLEESVARLHAVSGADWPPR